MTNLKTKSAAKSATPTPAGSVKTGSYTKTEADTILKYGKKYPDNRIQGFQEAAVLLNRSPSNVTSKFYDLIKKKVPSKKNNQQVKDPATTNREVAAGAKAVPAGPLLNGDSDGNEAFLKMFVERLNAREKKSVLRQLVDLLLPG